MKSLFRLFLLLLAVGVTERAAAQYYSWGADAPMRWQQLDGRDVRVIVPDTACHLGQRTLHYIHAVQPYVGEGFTHGAMRIPFVLHPENQQSNALVMYMPKRVDFLTSPAIESYSMPWIKQLVAHEYRHAVQYNNLNRGVPRILSGLLGQQGSVTGLLFMPLWAIEGDAVMNETQMSTYGRALQPSFSMGYRALGEAVGRSHRGKEQRNIDRWFCGSYRDYIPDHYELGYQLTSYAYDRYGENIWDKVVRYGVRNPYTLAPTHIALKKYYNTSTRTLFQESFEELNRHWASLPEVEPNSRLVVEPDTTNYTTYRWPIELNETELLVLKESYSELPRFVKIDAQGNERLVAYAGRVTTPPTLLGDTLYWTQYRRSMLFEERVGSALYCASIYGKGSRRVRGVENALYPTASAEGLAWVEYRPDGHYALMVAGKTRIETPQGVELHGLAWDNRTKAFYTIVTSDEGMQLARIDSEGLHPLRRAAYVTLSDLRARDGYLYFGSIASGRDEVHCYDLLARREYRLSQSVYGSFDPAPATSGLWVTSYNRYGYLPAKIDQPLMEPVEWQPTPDPSINPARRGWQTINLDTVQFSSIATEQLAETTPAKPFRKALRGVHVHSWAPVAYDPFRAVDEHVVALNLGATLLSQNLLSNTEAYAAYGWSEVEGSMVGLGVRYTGLGVHLGLDFDYGGTQQCYALATYDAENEQYLYQPRPMLDRFRQTTLSATLPLIFDRPAGMHQLSISAAWSYSNGVVARMSDIKWAGQKIANIDRVGYNEGLQKVSFGVGYAAQARLAHRDFLPRWGYQLSASYGLNPTNSDFANLYTLYGHFYMPGFLPHNSIQVAASFQNSVGGYEFPYGYRPLTYRSTALVPRGFTTGEFLSDKYAALSLNYRLPLCYPEWGIPSLLYMKRVRLGLGGDVARFNYYGQRVQLRSVGGELSFDFNALRMPSSATSSLTIACFRTSHNKTWISASLGLPF